MSCQAGRLVAVLALVAGCGGGVDEAAAPEQVVPRRARPATAQVASQSGELVREVFAYSGGSRDPFESLIASASVGPELPDLSLVGIYIDQADRDRSVVTLRERLSGKRYNLRAGDRLGRLRVAAIRERDVDFIVDDFGTERRESLSLRKLQEDETP
jgi:hypothetical protein